jgi:hypothetical protein
MQDPLGRGIFPSTVPGRRQANIGKYRVFKKKKIVFKSGKRKSESGNKPEKWVGIRKPTEGYCRPPLGEGANVEI